MAAFAVWEMIEIYLPIENRGSYQNLALRSLSKPGAFSDVPGLAFRSIRKRKSAHPGSFWLSYGGFSAL